VDKNKSAPQKFPSATILGRMSANPSSGQYAKLFPQLKTYIGSTKFPRESSIITTIYDFFVAFFTTPKSLIYKTKYLPENTSHFFHIQLMHS